MYIKTPDGARHLVASYRPSGLDESSIDVTIVSSANTWIIRFENKEWRNVALHVLDGEPRGAWDPAEFTGRMVLI